MEHVIELIINSFRASTSHEKWQLEEMAVKEWDAYQARKASA